MNRVLKSWLLGTSSITFAAKENKRKIPSLFTRPQQLTLRPQSQSQSHGRIHSSSFQVIRILQDSVKVSSNRNTFPGFRVYCTKEDLSLKKCVPCNAKDMRPMTEEAAQLLIPKVPEWDLVNEGGILKLNRSLKVKSFIKGLDLFRAIAEVAEAEGHHPDLHLVGWNNVKIEIWTHSVNGLTENDFILATKINALDVQNLLRRKAAN